MCRVCRSGGLLLAILLTASSVNAQNASDSAKAGASGAPTPVADSATSAPSKPGKPSKPSKPEPFAFADFTWLTGNSREKSPLLDSKYFTGEFRADVNYIGDFANPKDHTLDGAAEAGRTGEVQVQQLGVGGDFHYDNVRGRLMTQFGLYSELTPRDDASPARGQWNLADAYRYISEAYGGYHWNAWNGINLDAGIFLSYIGLFSYYNYDNWAYQPSYVSANTPWFFDGIRIQTFPSDKLKIEYWIINGWQSYGMFNDAPGFGTQILWRPTGSLELLTNDYWGFDTPNTPTRSRWHTDNSIEVKYYDDPTALFDKSAFSVTLDAGCESGGGVQCASGTTARPVQYFLGYMVYDRLWFAKDLFGITLGNGAITNPGRYLVLLPPINGATATSGTPYFSTSPGSKFNAWDTSITADYMPSQYITFRGELIHREASAPYFVGPGGITPPGGNTGAAGSIVPGWAPDLRKTETRLDFAILVKM